MVASGEGIVLAADKWGKLKMVIQSIAISIALLKNYPLSLLTNFPFDKYAMLLAVIITIYSGYVCIAKNKNIINSF